MRSEPRSDGRSQLMVVWLGRFGLVLAAVWGFSEATLFFIVPDVIVGLIALHHPRKALWAGGAAVAGACVGGALLYAVGSQIGADLRSVWTPFRRSTRRCSTEPMTRWLRTEAWR